MASRRAPNLVDQFSKTVPVVHAPAPLPPVHAPLPVSAPAPALPVVPVMPAPVDTPVVNGGGATGSASTTTCSKSGGGLACWLKANWGKALGVSLVVVVTTIFIVRAVLVARNKRRAKEEEKRAAASANTAEWESFLDDAASPSVDDSPLVPSRAPTTPVNARLLGMRPLPSMPPHMMGAHATPNSHLPPMPPGHMPPHMPPHMPHAPPHMHPHMPASPPPPPPPVAGVTPLPPPHVPLTPVQHAAAAHAEQQDGGRGIQNRLPPAEGSQGHGGGPGFMTLMPESTRPIRTPAAAHSQVADGGGGSLNPGAGPGGGGPNATFTITDTKLPTVAPPEQDGPSREGPGDHGGSSMPSADRGDMPAPDIQR